MSLEYHVCHVHRMIEHPRNLLWNPDLYKDVIFRKSNGAILTLVKTKCPLCNRADLEEQNDRSARQRRRA